MAHQQTSPPGSNVAANKRHRHGASNNMAYQRAVTASSCLPLRVTRSVTQRAATLTRSAYRHHNIIAACVAASAIVALSVARQHKRRISGWRGGSAIISSQSRNMTWHLINYSSAMLIISAIRRSGVRWRQNEQSRASFSRILGINSVLR